MSHQQQKHYEQRQQAERRRAELVQLIAHGEDSLFACDDNRTRYALNQKLTALRNELQRLEAELAQTVHESFFDFKARMGCDCIRLSQDDIFQDARVPNHQLYLRAGCYLFNNGASSDGAISHQEPSPVLLSRLLAQRVYVVVTIQRESIAFLQLKAECDVMDHSHKNWPTVCRPAPGWTNDELRRRQAVIAGLQEQLKVIDQQIDAMPEVQAQAAQRKRDHQATNGNQREILQRQAERASLTI